MGLASIGGSGSRRADQRRPRRRRAAHDAHGRHRRHRSPADLEQHHRPGHRRVQRLLPACEGAPAACQGSRLRLRLSAATTDDDDAGAHHGAELHAQRLGDDGGTTAGTTATTTTPPRRPTVTIDQRFGLASQGCYTLDAHQRDADRRRRRALPPEPASSARARFPLGSTGSGPTGRPLRRGHHRHRRRRHESIPPPSDGRQRRHHQHRRLRRRHLHAAARGAEVQQRRHARLPLRGRHRQHRHQRHHLEPRLDNVEYVIGVAATDAMATSALSPPSTAPT